MYSLWYYTGFIGSYYIHKCKICCAKVIWAGFLPPQPKKNGFARSKFSQWKYFRLAVQWSTFWSSQYGKVLVTLHHNRNELSTREVALSDWSMNLAFSKGFHNVWFWIKFDEYLHSYLLNPDGSFLYRHPGWRRPHPYRCSPSATLVTRSCPDQDLLVFPMIKTQTQKEENSID